MLGDVQDTWDVGCLLMHTFFRLIALMCLPGGAECRRACYVITLNLVLGTPDHPRPQAKAIPKYLPSEEH